VLRTRVGYAGGMTAAPTYRSIGDHSEAIEIDFDPTLISYADLLENFFATHNACRAPYSTQYRSAIFTHGDKQQASARKAAERIAAERGQAVATAIESHTGFTLAEDYHQKYILQADPSVMTELQEFYPTMAQLLESTAVTRANAFLGGNATRRVVDADLPRMGLSEDVQQRIRTRLFE
jgi:methionine-S-sulfoxide reductase